MYSNGKLGGAGFHPDHVDPVSDYCNYAGLGGYTHILRVEEQALWFDWFVEHFGLANSMKEFRANGNVGFIPRVNASSGGADNIPYIVGRKPWPRSLWNSKHSRGSSGLVSTSYTSEMAQNATKLFWADFIHFGYPVWDGRPESFRYV